MKRVFVIAAALIAALPVAHANTYLFTSGTPGTSETTGSYPITVWGYNNASISGSGSNISLNGKASNLSYNSFGLGVAATNNEITLSSFVVVDFSDPGGPKPNGATTATFNIDNADSGWIIYGGNTAPVSGASGVSGGISGLSKIMQGSGNAPNQLVSIASYSYLAIIAAQTCYLDVYSISTNTPTPTPTPEPGTLAMAGMALIGLGVALRKSRKS